MLALCGAQRVGKSTLARAFAEKHGLEFIQTTTAQVMKELGVDPAKPMTFEVRMKVQKAILDNLERQYKQAPHDAICDRSPLDCLMYTLGDIGTGAVPESMRGEFESYVRRCFDMTNRYFSTVIVVQPGIPLIDEPGKAAADPAYIEHLTAIAMGLMVDERLKVAHFYIPRALLDLKERVIAVEQAVEKVVVRQMGMLESGSVIVH